MKAFHCGTVYPDCHWHTLDEDSEAIVDRAAGHMRTAHGQPVVGRGTLGLIRAHIHDEPAAWRGVRGQVDMFGWCQHISG